MIRQPVQMAMWPIGPLEMGAALGMGLKFLIPTGQMEDIRLVYISMTALLIAETLTVLR